MQPIHLTAQSRNFLPQLSAQNLNRIQTLLTLLSPLLDSLFLIAGTTQAPAVEIIQAVLAEKLSPPEHALVFVLIAHPAATFRNIFCTVERAVTSAFASAIPAISSTMCVQSSGKISTGSVRYNALPHEPPQSDQ